MAKFCVIKSTTLNKDNQVDKESLEIFEKIYQKYEYVFKELAKNG